MAERETTTTPTPTISLFDRLLTPVHLVVPAPLTRTENITWDAGWHVGRIVGKAAKWVAWMRDAVVDGVRTGRQG